MADSIVEILREFGSSSYWHGEDTGDYDQGFADEQDFFVETLGKINDKIEEAFLLGFMATQEGFNGECAFDNCAPSQLVNDKEFHTEVREIPEFKELLKEAKEKIG